MSGFESLYLNDLNFKKLFLPSIFKLKFVFFGHTWNFSIDCFYPYASMKCDLWMHRVQGFTFASISLWLLLQVAKVNLFAITLQPICRCLQVIVRQLAIPYPKKMAKPTPPRQFSFKNLANYPKLTMRCVATFSTSWACKKKKKRPLGDISSCWCQTWGYIFGGVPFFFPFQVKGSGGDGGK